MALIIHSNPTLLTTQNRCIQMLSLNGTTALSRRQKILEHIYAHTTFSDCEQTSKKKKSYMFPITHRENHKSLCHDFKARAPTV